MQRGFLSFFDNVCDHPGDADVTLSPERRRRDQQAALQIMAADVNDVPLGKMHWAWSDPRFEPLALTTWEELERRGFIVPCHISTERRAQLRPVGWLEGLRLNGTLEDPPFRAHCVDLVKYFKGLVKGRDGVDPARVHYRRLPAEFSFGWQRDTASFRVPQTFGMPKD